MWKHTAAAIHKSRHRMTAKPSNCDTCNVTAYDLEANNRVTPKTIRDDDSIKKEELYKVTMNNDNGNCLPSVTEIHLSDHHPYKPHPHHDVQQKEPSFFSSLSKSMIMNGCIVVIVVTFVLIMSFILFNKMSSSSSSVGIDSSVPFDYRTTSQYQRIMEYLVQNKVSSSTSLLTYGTPQYCATSYIANQLQ